MLAVDPAQVTKNVEHGVLLPRTSPSRPRPDGRPVDPSELVDEPVGDARVGRRGQRDQPRLRLRADVEAVDELASSACRRGARG
jgi:hypothetical protein